jgi:hypothetical protein
LERTLSIMPLSPFAGFLHHELMRDDGGAFGIDSADPLRLAVPLEDGGRRLTTLVLVEAEGTRRLAAATEWPWTRLAVHLLASSLDRQLAEGRSPESNARLGARARMLVAPAVRHEYARLLAHLEEQARRPPVMRSSRSPLNRVAIAACALRFAEVRRRLTGHHPVPARGIAMASRLLGDGTGPLYNRRLSARHLDDALARIMEQLDPLLPLDAAP